MFHYFFISEEVKQLLLYQFTENVAYQILTFIIDFKLIIKKHTFLQEHIRELKKRHYPIPFKGYTANREMSLTCHAFHTSCCRIPYLFPTSFLDDRGNKGNKGNKGSKGEKSSESEVISLWKLSLLKTPDKFYSLMMSTHYGSHKRTMCVLEIQKAALEYLDENEMIPGQGQIMWHIMDAMNKYTMEYLNTFAIMRNDFIGTASAVALKKYIYKQRLTGMIPFTSDNFCKIMGCTSLWKKHIFEKLYKEESEKMKKTEREEEEEEEKEKTPVLFLRTRRTKFNELSGHALRAYHELAEAVFEIEF